jgi:hypothetical protein
LCPRKSAPDVYKQTLNKVRASVGERVGILKKPIAIDLLDEVVA